MFMFLMFLINVSCLCILPQVMNSNNEFLREENIKKYKQRPFFLLLFLPLPPSLIHLLLEYIFCMREARFQAEFLQLNMRLNLSTSTQLNYVRLISNTICLALNNHFNLP